MDPVVWDVIGSELSLREHVARQDCDIIADNLVIATSHSRLAKKTPWVSEVSKKS